MIAIIEAAVIVAAAVEVIIIIIDFGVTARALGNRFSFPLN